MKYRKLLLGLICVLAIMVAACGRKTVDSSAVENANHSSTSITDASTSEGVSSQASISEDTSKDTSKETEKSDNSISDESDTSDNEPEKAVFTFTRGNYPLFDGSTSLRPLAVGIASLLLGEPREKVDGMFEFHMTDEAYYYLMNGKANILIAAQGCDEVMDKMAERGFEYEMEPIAMEGLVFVVNVNNPIDSLTIEQIKGIYTGKIKNWSEVGGEDKEIVAYQRTETSGSQVMMRKCVMTDEEMVQAPTELMPGLMGELIDGVAAYNNSANAIGYTVYYYADSMKMADGLKIIKVDGIEPCNETIGSGKYPFTNPYFCLVRQSSGENSPERLIYDWLVTEDGQKLVELEGYVPVSKAK